MVRVKIYVDKFGYEHLVIEGFDFQVRYKKWGRKALAYVFDKLRDKIKKQNNWSRMKWKENNYEYEMKIDDKEFKELIEKSGTKYKNMILKKIA